MNSKDLASQLTQTSVSAIAARTSTVTSSAVDVRGYKGGLVIEQLVGVEGRQHEHWGPARVVEVACRGDAVHDGHADVHQHDVGSMALH